MNRENDLFMACQILFGSDIVPSRGFLEYLLEEGITSAFRKRAMEIHPDKALLAGLSQEKCQQEFVALQNACETLREHVASRHVKQQKILYPQRVKEEIPPINKLLPEKKLLFGRFLYHAGIIQWRQLIYALAWQKSTRLKIGELAIQMGYLERNSIGIILKNLGQNSSFGLTALELGLLTRAEVKALLFRQRCQQKRLGQFFVEDKILSNVELDVLLGQCKHHNRQVQLIMKR